MSITTINAAPSATESIFTKCKRLYTPEQVARHLLPTGELRGLEWVARNPTRNDNSPGSFSINTKTGVWKDFANGDHGGDHIDLWGYVRGIDEPYEAARQMDAELNGREAPPEQTPQAKTRDRDHVDILSPVPDDASPATFVHPKHGLCPSYFRFAYMTPEGRLLGYVCRWDTEDGKAIAPRFYWRCADGVMRWCWAGPKPPRLKPLYRMHTIRDCETIWLVEGEKTADRGAVYVGKSTAILSWMGGSQAVDHVDFSPLAGKRVVLIPDHDAKLNADKTGLLPYDQQPGVMAMISAGKKLAAMGCRVIFVDYKIDPERDGWDLADAADANWTREQVHEMMQTNKRPFGVVKTFNPTVSEENNALFGSVKMYAPIRIDRFVSKPNGQGPLDCWQNIATMLNDYGISCRFNEMTYDVEMIHETSNLAISGEELLSLCNFNNIAYRNRGDHISVIAHRNAYHPALDWVRSEKWDGKDRIGQLFKTMTIIDTPQELAFRLLYRTLIQAVAMLSQEVVGDAGSTPEAHGVLTIVGDQSVGKTRWIRRLCPVDFNMVGCNLVVGNKDSELKALSRWIVELGEVSATKQKSSAELLKGFLTSPVDLIRPPYGRRAIEMKRRTVFIATENNTRFLVDETGNRRWWTIRVKSLDHNHMVDMQQLWAQAYYLMGIGEQWWLTHEELIELNKNNLKHEELDPVSDLLTGGLMWSELPSRWTWRPMAAILRQVGWQRIDPQSCRRGLRFMRAQQCQEKQGGHRSIVVLAPPPCFDYTAFCAEMKE